MAESRLSTSVLGADCTTARRTPIYAHGATQSSVCRMCLEPLITARGRRGRYQEDRSGQVVEPSRALREVLQAEQVQQYNKVAESCAAQLEAFAAACPYNQDRISRGLQVSIPLEPDDVEQWALQAT